jgi:hypothetical protein
MRPILGIVLDFGGFGLDSFGKFSVGKNAYLVSSVLFSKKSP